MSLQATEPRQHMSTLTNGWRFTLPTAIRISRGWDTGTRLIARLRGASLVFCIDGQSPADSAVGSPHSVAGAGSVDSREPLEMSVSRPQEPAMPIRGNLAEELGDGEFPAVDCYVGSGGKVVLPASLRKHLGWVIGKRLVIVDEGDVVAITLCCDAKRCESCASISGVREVIPNVYLCSQCWQKYLNVMNSKLKWGRIKA